MSNEMPETIDINPCPVCGLEHKGLELPVVELFRGETKTEAVLTCPTKDEQFTVDLEEYK
jgi:hypothetical protein